MKVTSNIIQSEFIGTKTEIVESPHSDYLGISGRIMDETRNTFLISSGEEKKRIIKESSVFHFQFSDGKIVEIDGQLLVGRPEDRLKKQVKRLW